MAPLAPSGYAYESETDDKHRGFREVAFVQRYTLNIGTHSKSNFNKKFKKGVALILMNLRQGP